MNPRTAKVGTGTILLTNPDFTNGYQVGHLSYMAERAAHPHPYTDEEIEELFLEKLEDVVLSTPYGIGFCVGWLHTLATKGTPTLVAADITVSSAMSAVEGKPSYGVSTATAE